MLFQVLIGALKKDPQRNGLERNRRVLREPEHSILIQVSFNKEYEIVNGLNNIEKFSLDQYKNNIVFDLQGHGNTNLSGERNAASLSDTVAHIIKTLPEKMTQIHNALDGVEAIKSNQVNVVPFLVDMGACLQGRRSPYFYGDIVNEGDKIRTTFNKRGSSYIDLKLEISNSIDINLLKQQQSKTFTQKFMDNFSRSLSGVNADELTRPVIFEAYDDSVFSSEFGDDLPSEFAIKAHKIYMLDKGLVLEVDPEDIEYRFTGSTGLPDLFGSHVVEADSGLGFFEYKITNPILINKLSPNNQENFKGFRKVFRGKPEINPFASE